MGTWDDPDLGRPIAAPLEQCAELLGVDLITICAVATKVEPYLRADGTGIWSLILLERQPGLAVSYSLVRANRSVTLDRRGAAARWWPGRPPQ